MLTHTESFTTRYHEMGTDHRLRVQSLCNYMEEAAGVHATALGVGLEQMSANGLTWVLAKMSIRFHRMPGAHEQVLLETWPAGVERLQFRRDFALRDTAGALLAAAVTQWVVIGLASRRVERMPQDIAKLQPETPRYAVEDGDIRIPAVDGAAAGPVFPVRLADIDQNNHVNNVRYVDFALEAAHVFGASGTLRQLDLIFRAEGLRGDVIAATTAKEEGGPGTRLVHSLRRQSDGQELARARTIFD